MGILGECMYLIDVWIPHFERLKSLKDCLGSISSQDKSSNWRFRDIVVLDDSRFDIRDDVVESIRWLKTQASVRFFDYRDGKPQWSRKFNTAFDRRHTKVNLNVYNSNILISIVSCDFVLDKNFFNEAISSLERHGIQKSLILAPGLNRDPRKAQIRGGPIGGDDKLLSSEHPDHADNGMLWIFNRDDWVSWDEEFDKIGFGHQVPEWLHRMSASGVKLWRCDRLNEVHQDHPPYHRMEEEVKKSEGLYSIKKKLIKKRLI